MGKNGKISVSVVMCAYRGEAYIGEQLRSLFTQTQMPDEVIICDDSPDNATEQVISQEAAAAPCPVKYFRNPATLGVVRNFEKAIGRASGELIFLCDQDDVWHNDKIAKLTGLFTADPDCGGVFCNSRIVDAKLHEQNDDLWSLRNFTLSEQQKVKSGQALEVFLRRVPCSGHNLAFSADLRSLLLPLPELPNCHDTWIGMVIAAASHWRMTSECLTDYRIHDANASAPGRRGLLGKLREARKSINDNTFAWNASLLHALLERLQRQNMVLPPADLALIRDRIDYSTVRAKMPDNIFRRIIPVVRETINGRYFRYGRGWQNAVQDLFLRRWFGPKGQEKGKND